MFRPIFLEDYRIERNVIANVPNTSGKTVAYVVKENSPGEITYAIVALSVDTGLTVVNSVKAPAIVKIAWQKLLPNAKASKQYTSMIEELFKILVNEENYVLISDKNHSRQTYSVWKRIMDNPFTVKMLDIGSGATCELNANLLAGYPEKFRMMIDG